MLTASISFVFSFFNRNKLDPILVPLIWLFLASVLTDIASLVLLSFNLNNLFLGNIFTIYQYVVLFLLYDRKNSTPLLKVLFGTSIVFGAINLIFIQTPLRFNSYTFYISAIVLVISGINYLYYLVNRLPIGDVKMHPMLWITLGTFTYYAGTAFIFLFSNYMVSNFPEIHQKIWVLHNLLGVSKNIMFYIALWVNFKSRTSSS